MRTGSEGHPVTAKKFILTVCPLLWGPSEAAVHFVHLNLTSRSLFDAVLFIHNVYFSILDSDGSRSVAYEFQQQELRIFQRRKHMKCLENTTFSPNYKYIMTVLCFLSSFNVVTISQITKEMTAVSVFWLCGSGRDRCALGTPAVRSGVSFEDWSPQAGRGPGRALGGRRQWGLRCGLHGGKAEVSSRRAAVRRLGTTESSAVSWSRPCVRTGLGRDLISLSLWLRRTGGWPCV